MTNKDEDLSQENSNENTTTQETKEDVSAQDSLTAELEKAKNDYLYLKAEFENFKRRAIKERSDLLRFGGERLAYEILTVIDDFERSLATEVTAENFASFRIGVEMIARQLTGVLKQFGIEEIPSQGVAFDPNVHEALASQESSEVEPGFVLQTLRKPYKMHDKVIRPGQVVVAKTPSTPTQEN